MERSLLNGHVARFVPGGELERPGGFQFTVTDAGGSTLTRQMNLFSRRRPVVHAHLAR